MITFCIKGIYFVFGNLFNNHKYLNLRNEHVDFEYEKTLMKA